MLTKITNELFIDLDLLEYFRWESDRFSDNHTVWYKLTGSNEQWLLDKDREIINTFNKVFEEYKKIHLPNQVKYNF